jgi:ankyrin repeat protein
LHLACISYKVHTHIDTIKKLLELCDLHLYLNAQDNEGFTPLMCAVNRPSADKLVELLLKAGANPNIKNKAGNSAIQIAISVSTEITKQLLEYDADPNIKNNLGANALLISIYNPSDLTNNIVKILLEAGANPSTKFINLSALQIAIKNNNCEVVKLLLKANVNTEQSFSHAFSYALSYNDVNILKLLLEAGVKIETRDLNGHTNLGRAVRFGNIELIKLLLKAGANPNQQSVTTQDTALHHIFLSNPNAKEMISLLIAFGADSTIKNKKSIAALENIIAQFKVGNDIEIIKMLIKSTI